MDFSTAPFPLSRAVLQKSTQCFAQHSADFSAKNFVTIAALFYKTPRGSICSSRLKACADTET